MSIYDNNTGYDSSQAESLLNRLRAFLGPAQLRTAIYRGGLRVAQQGESYAREYPPRRIRPLTAYYTRYRADGTPYKSKFKTLKQQRFFFWALAAGRIKVPYVRTGQLGGSITSDEHLGDNGPLEVTVGTKEPYGAYVMGDKRGPGEYQYPMQSFYHAKNGWQRLPEKLALHTQDLLDVFGTSLYDSLLQAMEGNFR